MGREYARGYAMSYSRCGGYLQRGVAFQASTEELSRSFHTCTHHNFDQLSQRLLRFYHHARPADPPFIRKPPVAGENDAPLLESAAHQIGVVDIRLVRCIVV